MASISVTRLRLRSFRFFPAFLWFALRSRMQARRAPGNRGVAVRRLEGAFWTLTLWDSAAAVRDFMTGGAHRQVMPRLMHWCDEASLVRWEENTDRLPDWESAERRLATEGRLSKVRHPSPAQQAGKTLGS
jgi:hypothetical protein